MFSVVEFTKDKEVSAVPHVWIDSEGKLFWWPSYKVEAQTLRRHALLVTSQIRRNENCIQSCAEGYSIKW